MKKNKIIKILFALIAFPEVVLAINFGCGYYGFGGTKTLLEGVDTSELSGITQLIMNIVDFIIGCLVLPAMVLVIIVSGVYIMTSIGNPGKVELGKKVLLAGIIGLIIVSAAHAFLQVWAPKLELPSPPPLPSK